MDLGFKDNVLLLWVHPRLAYATAHLLAKKAARRNQWTRMKRKVKACSRENTKDWRVGERPSRRCERSSSARKNS